MQDAIFLFNTTLVVEVMGCTQLFFVVVIELYAVSFCHGKHEFRLKRPFDMKVKFCFWNMLYVTS